MEALFIGSSRPARPGSSPPGYRRGPRTHPDELGNALRTSSARRRCTRRPDRWPPGPRSLPFA